MAAMAYNATAVNNDCKMFVKLTPDYYTLSQLMDKKLETPKNLLIVVMYTMAK